MVDAKAHQRRSIRLKGYDYAQPGAYFVTLVTHGRVCLFGEIVEHAMRLNRAGHVVQVEWQRLPEHFPDARLDAFVIMPNHVHGVIVIGDGSGATGMVQTGNPTYEIGATRVGLMGKVEDRVSPPDGIMESSVGSPLRGRANGPGQGRWGR